MMDARSLWRRAWLLALPLSAQIPFDEWLNLSYEDLECLLSAN